MRVFNSRIYGGWSKFLGGVKKMSGGVGEKGKNGHMSVGEMT